MQDKITYPNGAKFAFTILDDTDDTTVENGRPVYELFKEAAMRTTKTVWAFDSKSENREAYLVGDTLQSAEYLEWVHELSRDGFEIAFHNASMGSSRREDTIKALDFIEKEFGRSLRLHCNHGQNRENLYWGADRYSSCILNKAMHNLSKNSAFPSFEGHQPESPYYWADIASERLSYMRAFSYRQLNGMQIVPGKPFKDPLKANTPLLFNTAEAPHVHAFNKLVNPGSLEKLCKQGGWAIVTTHIGKGFYANNKLNTEFKQTIKYLSEQPGWFVTASELLDYIRMKKGIDVISPMQRFRMEYSHVLERLMFRLQKSFRPSTRYY